MNEWPSDYDTVIHPANVGLPKWRKAQVLAAGAAMARRFGQEPAFAMAYLAVVKQHYAAPDSDHTALYRDLILQTYSNPETTEFNASDYANIHRATWLILLERFACLVDKNPHGHNDWGDPPQKPGGGYGISRGEEPGPDFFHNIPNQLGFFAISTADIPPPALDF